MFPNRGEIFVGRLDGDRSIITVLGQECEQIVDQRCIRFAQVITVARFIPAAHMHMADLLHAGNGRRKVLTGEECVIDIPYHVQVG